MHRDNVRSSFLSGLFAAPKNLTRDRLILDARPANMADKSFAEVVQVYMASAAILSDIVLEEDEILIASGEDLRDFFYQFRVGEERARRTLDEAAYVFGTAPAAGLSPFTVGFAPWLWATKTLASLLSVHTWL